MYCTLLEQMNNYIQYRFFSDKNYTKIDFQGSSIPLWELRNEIITQQNMTSEDFELHFFDEQMSPITDDYFMISRNYSIIIKRLPLWMSKNQETKKKETLRTFTKISKPISNSYICYRCGQKGHFIQDCPTNTDKNYDYVRIRKPTGIPKSFLKYVDEKNEEAVMVTEKGFVKVELQSHEWDKLSQGLNLNIPEELKCKNCGLLFNMPVTTDCGHVYCESCISINDKCLICKVKVKKLTDNYEMRRKISKFIEEKEQKK